MSDAQLLDTDGLLSLPPQRWLVHKHLPEGGQTLIYGAPSSGKSFIALDMALCVSTGKPWLGRYPVQQGHVVYVVGEGASGVQKRVVAWMRHYGVTRLPHISWHVGPMSVHVDGEIAAFLDVLDETVCGRHSTIIGPDGRAVEAGVSLKLVIIDTLSRCFGGRDENDSDAMAEFVDKIQSFSNDRGAAVMTVHHTNAAGTRERGHTSLRGAMDAAFEVKAKDGDDGLIEFITLENDKQKDDRKGVPMYLRPVEVETGLPAVDGEPSRSLVLEWQDPPEKPEKGSGTPQLMGGKEMLRVLGVAEEGLTYSEWRYACGGIPSATFARRIKRLKAKSIIHQEDGKYVITAATPDLADLGEDDE